MRFYWVHDGEPAEHSEAVVANTAREAKRLAWRDPWGEWWGEYTDLRAKWERGLAPDGPARVLRWEREELALIRQAGGHTEAGQEECGSCGLSSMDDDRWLVCEYCHQCPECGCECETEESQGGTSVLPDIGLAIAGAIKIDVDGGSTDVWAPLAEHPALERIRS